MNSEDRLRHVQGDFENEEKCKKCGGIPPFHTNSCPVVFNEFMVLYGGKKEFQHQSEGDSSDGAVRLVNKPFAPKPKKKEKKLKWEMEKLPDLQPLLKNIKQVLLHDIILKAYKFATSGGKIKLEDLDGSKGMNKDAVSNLDKVQGFMKKGFETSMKELNVQREERELLIYHIIRDVERGFERIEKTDPGATSFMIKAVIAQMKDLKIYPEELDGRYDENGMAMVQVEEDPEGEGESA